MCVEDDSVVEVIKSSSTATSGWVLTGALSFKELKEFTETA
jgi:hypothetical protein